MRRVAAVLTEEKRYVVVDIYITARVEMRRTVPATV